MPKTFLESCEEETRVNFDNFGIGREKIFIDFRKPRIVKELMARKFQKFISITPIIRIDRSIELPFLQIGTRV